MPRKPKLTPEQLAQWGKFVERERRRNENRKLKRKATGKKRGRPVDLQLAYHILVVRFAVVVDRVKIAEIARALGIRPNTARQALKRWKARVEG